MARAVPTLLAVLLVCVSSVTIPKDSEELKHDDPCGTMKTKKKSHDVVIQPLINGGDGFAYYGTIHVGHQKQVAIYDTGSFDNVVLSSCVGSETWVDRFKATLLGINKADCCATSSCPHAAYKTHDSSCFKWVEGGAVEEISYGSGDTWCKAGTDTLAIHGKDATRMVHTSIELSSSPVQVIVDAKIDLFQSSNLQSIFGIGYAASQPGMLLDQLGVKRYMMCFQEDATKDGVMYWHDHDRRKMKEWQEVPSVGKMWFAAQTTNWGLKHETGKKIDVFGCEEGCGAIVDSGTSLMVVPPEVVDGLTKLLEKSGIADCSDLKKFPTFHFTLGNLSFSLPPTAYIAEAEGTHDLSRTASLSVPMLPLTQEDREAHEHAKAKGKPVKVKACALMFESDPNAQKTPYGKMIIMGMPVFRKYAVQFDTDGRKNPKMRFAEANHDCTGYKLAKNVAPHTKFSRRFQDPEVKLPKMDMTKARHSPIRKAQAQWAKAQKENEKKNKKAKPSFWQI